jgi:hypothetical protein
MEDGDGSEMEDGDGSEMEDGDGSTLLLKLLVSEYVF